VSVFADPIVDWATLGKVVAAALIAGISVTAAFSIAVLGVTRSAEMRRAQRALEAGAFAVVGVLGGAFCVAAIAGGILVMAQK
jgi:integral membrane sensor domain MASE1